MRRLGDVMEQIKAHTRDSDGWAADMAGTDAITASTPTTPAFVQGRMAAMARRRWRALRNLRDELLRPPAGVLDPTRPEHPLHPAHAVQQDVRAVLGRTMLKVARYRATASTFAALLAAQFDMPQEVRASPLMARVFFAFARDHSVGGNGDPELARTSSCRRMSRASAAAHIGSGAPPSADGGDSGDADGDSARGWAWWDSNDDENDYKDDEDGESMLSLALQARDSASAIDPRAQSPLRRIGTATEIDAISRAGAAVTMTELTVDMRAVVCALMILFPPSSFVSLSPAAQLQQLFDVYTNPENVAAQTHVAVARGMKHHLTTPPASPSVQVAANKRNMNLNDPADAVPRAEALAVVSIASVTAGERMLTETALEAVLSDHAAMVGHPSRCYNTISADAFSTALLVAPGIAEAYSAQAESRRFEAGADKNLMKHYSVSDKGASSLSNERTFSAVLDAESVMRERRLEQLSVAGDALEKRVQHHETTGRWEPLVHFMGDDKEKAHQKVNDQSKMLDMGTVAANLLMTRHKHQRRMNRRRSSAIVQASLHAPWKAEPIERIRERLKFAGPPPAVSRLPVAHIAVGAAHTLMTLRRSSLLLSFGKGANGRLGHGDEFDRCRPRVVAMLQQLEIMQLAAGGAHSLVVDHAANVYAFGSDEFGQCGHADEVKTKYLLPKRVEADALVMPPDEFGLKVAAPVMMVAAGDKHSAALVNDRQTPRYGIMFTWGQTQYGQCGFRDHHTDQGLPQREPRCVMSMLHSEVTHVACGSRHTLCIAALGPKNEHREEDLGVKVGQAVVYSWGCGSSGQLGHGDTQNVRAPKVIDTLVDVVVPRLCSAGSSHSLVLTEKGEVYSFGEGTGGRLGHGGYMYDGKMRSADCPIPRLIEKLRGYEVVAVAAGLHHSIVLANTCHTSGEIGRNSPKTKHKHREAETPKEFDGEGEVFIFGSAADGRLGVGLGPNPGPVHGKCCACGLEGHGERCDDSVRKPRRLRIPSESLACLAVQRIGAGNMSSTFVSATGEVFTCGLSQNGRLGHGPPQPDAGIAHRHGGAHEFTPRRVDEFEAPSRDCPGFHIPALI
eukprot:g1944.t1